MSRNNTQALHSIRMMCRMQQVDEKVLYDRSRLILSIYRDVCWSTMGRAEEVYDDLICTCGTSLDGALIYLETFAPDEARERFEEKIRSLFETKWIIELVDNAMGRIREPIFGGCILSSKNWMLWDVLRRKAIVWVFLTFSRMLMSKYCFPVQNGVNVM